MFSVDVTVTVLVMVDMSGARVVVGDEEELLDRDVDVVVGLVTGGVMVV